MNVNCPKCRQSKLVVETQLDGKDLICLICGYRIPYRSRARDAEVEELFLEQEGCRKKAEDWLSNYDAVIKIVNYKKEKLEREAFLDAYRDNT